MAAALTDVQHAVGAVRRVNIEMVTQLKLDAQIVVSVLVYGMVARH